MVVPYLFSRDLRMGKIQRVFRKTLDQGNMEDGVVSVRTPDTKTKWEQTT